MKNIVFILSGFILLTVTSCNKEKICPNSIDNEYENQTSRSIDDSDYNNKSNSPNNSGYGGLLDSKLDSLFNITDPNRDEDDERRAKRK